MKTDPILIGRGIPSGVISLQHPSTTQEKFSPARSRFENTLDIKFVVIKPHLFVFLSCILVTEH